MDAPARQAAQCQRLVKRFWLLTVAGQQSGVDLCLKHHSVHYRSRTAALQGTICWVWPSSECQRRVIHVPGHGWLTSTCQLKPRSTRALFEGCTCNCGGHSLLWLLRLSRSPQLRQRVKANYAVAKEAEGILCCACSQHG